MAVAGLPGANLWPKLGTSGRWKGILKPGLPAAWDDLLAQFSQLVRGLPADEDAWLHQGAHVPALIGTCAVWRCITGTLAVNAPASKRTRSSRYYQLVGAKVRVSIRLGFLDRGCRLPGPLERFLADGSSFPYRRRQTASRPFQVQIYPSQSGVGSLLVASGHD